ncbi:MAG: hypothetical protein RIC55_34145 [Pirellulaceae bacterium]
MKLLAPVGTLIFLLAAAAAQAQVVGGYSTLGPSPIASAPVFDDQPMYTARRIEPTQRADTVDRTASLQPIADEQQMRSAVLRQVGEVDETRSVLRRSNQGGVMTANFQQPSTFTPVEQSLQPVPMDGALGAEYYAPTLGARTVPIQASAAVPMTTSGACCNPCVQCCMPVQQVSAIPQTVLPQTVSVAGVPSQLPPNHFFGRGIVGQPVAYVEGQPLRNFFRAISP